MSRFFILRKYIKGNLALIDGPEAHHILDVMRLKEKDPIQVFDGSGKFYQGRILDTAHKKVKVQIESVVEQVSRSNLGLTLIQALPKRERMDYIVEKCTELGIDFVIPVQTARTVVRLDRQRLGRRQRRWQRIAEEASKQCARTTIPQVQALVHWPQLLPKLARFDLKLLFCLDDETLKLRDVLRARAQRAVKKVALFIGPEGGFTPGEIRQARQAGCLAVSLGTHVLKSDTAAISAVTMINYELNG